MEEYFSKLTFINVKETHDTDFDRTTAKVYKINILSLTQIIRQKILISRLFVSTYKRESF